MKLKHSRAIHTSFYSEPDHPEGTSFNPRLGLNLPQCILVCESVLTGRWVLDSHPAFLEWFKKCSTAME